MAHNEFRRILPDADTAVLFIHGIVGTPDHFKLFLPHVPKDFSLYNMLLDGHGKGVKAFSATSMDKWRKQVDEEIVKLSVSHKQIIIVGHSMGTLFAIEQAIKHSDKIKALFLMAVPLKIKVKPKLLSNVLKVYFGNIKPDDLMASASQNAYGIERDLRFWRYFAWLPRYIELFKEIRATRSIISQLNTPCSAYQSKNDEMVSPEAYSILSQNACIHTCILENSGHYYYDVEDMCFLLNEFKKLLSSFESR